MTTAGRAGLATATLMSALACLPGVAGAAVPSTHCARFLFARGITISGGSCQLAAHALRSGHFGGASKLFSSAGWICVQAGNRPQARVACTNAVASLSFTA